MNRRLSHPAAVVALAFLAAIGVGTAVLMLQWAAADGASAGLLTALFTATSAVCVTGLVVVDTGTYWSNFGQVSILVLFQLGGFGMMASATLLGLVVNRQLRLSSRLVLQAETHSLALGDVRSQADPGSDLGGRVAGHGRADAALRARPRHALGPVALAWPFPCRFGLQQCRLLDLG